MCRLQVVEEAAVPKKLAMTSMHSSEIAAYDALAAFELSFVFGSVAWRIASEMLGRFKDEDRGVAAGRERMM